MLLEQSETDDPELTLALIKAWGHRFRKSTRRNRCLVLCKRKRQYPVSYVIGKICEYK
jgi:hypothetical protein